MNKNNWEEIKLSDTIQFVIGGDWGKDPSLSDVKEFVSARCIRGAELRDWEKNKGNTAVERKIKLSSAINRRLIAGDIILEISGGGPDQPVGRTAYIDSDVLDNFPSEIIICTNFFRLLRLSDELQKKFFEYFLKYFYNTGEVVKYQGGSNNLRNLRFNDYATIKIPLPPLNEQKRIVEKLDALFARIDNIKERMGKVQLLKEVLLSSYLFNSNNDNNGYEFLEKYIVEGTERIGEEWIGITKIGVSNSEGITELRTGQKATFEKYKIVKPGDFIYNTMRVNIGSIARYQGSEIAITSPDYVVFRVSKKISPELLLNYLKSDRGKLEINSKTRGGVRSRLYFSSLKQIQIPQIDICKHNEAETVFSFFRENRNGFLQIETKLDQLKESILIKAFKGELVPQDHNDEPAEKLLERILEQKAKLAKKVRKFKSDSYHEAAEPAPEYKKK